jgi:hypothetical protein
MPSCSRWAGKVHLHSLAKVLKMMVGNNLKDTQLQQIVDKTILLYDKVFGFRDECQLVNYIDQLAV